MESSFYIKTFVACFIPYESKGVLTSEEVDHRKVASILEEVDLEKLSSIECPKELIYYAINYFEGRVLSKKKFANVLCHLLLTYKGLEGTHLKKMVSPILYTHSLTPIVWTQR